MLETIFIPPILRKFFKQQSNSFFGQQFKLTSFSSQFGTSTKEKLLFHPENWSTQTVFLESFLKYIFLKPSTCMCQCYTDTEKRAPFVKVNMLLHFCFFWCFLFGKGRRRKEGRKNINYYDDSNIHTYFTFYVQCFFSWDTFMFGFVQTFWVLHNKHSELRKLSGTHLMTSQLNILPWSSDVLNLDLSLIATWREQKMRKITVNRKGNEWSKGTHLKCGQGRKKWKQKIFQ